MGHSSIGRAAAFEVVGCWFESNCPCQTQHRTAGLLVRSPAFQAGQTGSNPVRCTRRSRRRRRRRSDVPSAREGTRNLGSGPLGVRKKGRGDTAEDRSPTSPVAGCASTGSTRQAHRGATSAGSSSQEAAIVGTRVPGKERGFTHRPSGREWGPPNRKRVVASGLAEPTRHRVPERVARTVRASQARAARRSRGAWASQEARGSQRSAQ